jgi:hypothetical protein
MTCRQSVCSMIVGPLLCGTTLSGLNPVSLFIGFEREPGFHSNGRPP